MLWPQMLLKFAVENWRIITVITLLAGTYGAGWYKGSDSVTRDRDKAKAKQVAEQLAKNQTDLTKLNTLEVTKNENIAKIDKLRADNNSLRLRLPKGSCDGTGKTSTDTTARAGELPTQSEIYLAEAKRQLDDEARRADGIVENCRVLNDF